MRAVKKAGLLWLQVFQYPFKKIIDELSLEPLYMPSDPEEIMITNSDKPSGFTAYGLL